MADVETQPASAVNNTVSAATPKKDKKPKNPRSKPSHPPTSEMVNNAIKGLKERGGSSLQAIKKYIAANYKIDAEKFAPFIKKYLKGAVASGSLVQKKGKGASGSFRLASAVTGGAKSLSVAKKKSSVGSSSKTKKKGVLKRAGVVLTSGVEKGSASGRISKKTTAAAGSVSGRLKKTAAEKKSVASAKGRKSAVAAAAAAAAKKANAASRSPTKPKPPSKAKKSNRPGPTKKPKVPKPKSAITVAAKARKTGSPKKKK